MNKKTLDVIAYNIHTGGGRVVLHGFLKEKSQEYDSILCICDARLKFPSELYPKVQFLPIHSTIRERMDFEINIRKIIRKDSKVYFLGNLPPIKKITNKSTLFLQNRFLVDRPFFNFSGFKNLIQSAIELIWFKLFINHVSEIEVQTPIMAKKVKKSFNGKILLKNYFDYDELIPIKKSNEKSEYFIYISAAFPHKNHWMIVAALSILAKKNLYPKMIFTISPEENGSVIKKITKFQKKYKLNIDFLYNVPRSEVLEKLANAKALVWPSRFESCGLPILEAEYLKQKIILIENDFAPMKNHIPFKTTEELASVLEKAM
ncbi:glycosyltransferase [Bacteriovorax sp. PP10]|uniref:Glycosyltransferase n=1 Tax=Bacteriovorax antarcticus TaxID=3088717 RepID=A0ABU5VU94_9BACT|nr:glycosyltransferase [Bacteriovorax sp. PP10]MEA9356638.1 glycosyltransferase [Bacteriovorax sp. PP10]